MVFFSASLAPVKVKTISRFMMTEAVGASLLAGYDFFSFSSIAQFLAQCISLKNTQGSAGFLGDDAVASLLRGMLPFLLV